MHYVIPAELLSLYIMLQSIDSAQTYIMHN